MGYDGVCEWMNFFWDIDLKITVGLMKFQCSDVAIRDSNKSLRIRKFVTMAHKVQYHALEFFAFLAKDPQSHAMIS